MEPATPTPIPTPRPNNKFLIFALVGFGLLLLTILIIIFSSNTKTKKTVSETSPNQGLDTPAKTYDTGAGAQVSVEPSGYKKLKEYQNLNFGLKYPQNWKEVENYPDGTYLTLQPINMQKGETGHMAVEINNTTRVSVARMSSGLSQLGLKKENTKVAGIPAQKFSGAINFPGKTIHDSSYLFVHNAKVYFIKLSYMQVAVDPVLEQEFVEIVSTFTLK